MLTRRRAARESRTRLDCASCPSGGEILPRSKRQARDPARPADAAALAAERASLREAETLSFWPRTRVELRLLGPGYLQSAMTLGGGTCTAAIFAGRWALMSTKAVGENMVSEVPVVTPSR